jgi:hypothetical protein
MIRTVKPPPKVNPNVIVDNRANPVAPMRVDAAQEKFDNNASDFDFDAAVREEMRKMEEEFRRQLVPMSYDDGRGESLPQDDYYDLDRDRQNIPISVDVDPVYDMFEQIPASGHVLAEPNRSDTVHRKGAAINNLYGPSDDRLNHKAARAAEHALLLQQQVGL